VGILEWTGEDWAGVGAMADEQSGNHAGQEPNASERDKVQPPETRPHETPTRLSESSRPGSLYPGITTDSGRYEVVKEHARGGMGRILLAHDPNLGRDIALKELLPQAGEDSTSGWTPTDQTHPLVARFLREARITGQLEHPAITPVHELGQREDGTVYYTMKFVKGRTLDEAIKSCKNLKERLQLLPHFVDLCNAVAYAHSKGVIHRDLKPQNVLVGEFGETVVVDWGLAKVKDKEDIYEKELQDTLATMKTRKTAELGVTHFGEALGTPAYMPPEQVRGELFRIDERSDIYSLGVVLYQILTGQVPYSAKTPFEILEKVLDEPPRSPQSIDRKIPDDLTKVCLHAMAKKRGDRIASAKELGQIVERSKLRKPKGRIRKTLERGAIAAAIGVPLLIAFLNWYTERQYERVKAEIEASGISLDMSSPEVLLQELNLELIAPARDSREIQQINAVGALHAMEWLFPEFGNYMDDPRFEPWIATQTSVIRGLIGTLSIEQARILEEGVASRRPAMDFVRQAVLTGITDPSDIWNLISKGDIFQTRIHSLLNARAIATFLATDALLALHRDDPNAAVEEVMTGFQFVRVLEQEPNLINEMVRVACLSVLSEPIGAILSSGKLDDRHLASLDSALSQIEFETLIQRAYTAEILYTHWLFEWLSGNTPFGSEDFTVEDFTGAYLLLSIYRTWPLRFVLNNDRRTALELQVQMRENAVLPPHEFEVAAHALAIEMERVLSWKTPITSFMLPSSIRSKQVSLEAQSRVNCFRLAIAVERYRLAFGTLPKSFHELTPRFLEQLPEDLFGHGPYQLVQTHYGYQITGEDWRDEPYYSRWPEFDTVSAASQLYKYRNDGRHPVQVVDLVPDYLLALPESPISGARWVLAEEGEVDLVDANGASVMHQLNALPGRPHNMSVQVRVPK